MRIQDIIRNMVDMIDHMQLNHPVSTPKVIVAHPTATIDKSSELSPLTHAGDDINRFKQIVDLADRDECSPYGNSPNEKYADINSVTSDAGGGLNGPKHPADIRGSTVAMYPGAQDSDIGNDDHIVRISMMKTLGGD